MKHRTITDPNEIRDLTRALANANTPIDEVREVLFGRDETRGDIVLVVRKNGQVIELRPPQKPPVKTGGMSF